VNPDIKAGLQHVYGFLVRLTFTSISDRDGFLVRYNACVGGQVENNVFVVTAGDAKVPYTGVYRKRHAPTPEDYDALPKHATRTVDVDLQKAYAVKPGVTYSVAYRAYHGRPNEVGVQLIESPACIVKT
jgi:hypothetical protein